MRDMKKDVLEIAGIAKECPENLQAICFELLLKNYIDGSFKKPESKEKGIEVKPLDPKATEKADTKIPGESDVDGSVEILKSHLHVKTLRFMEKHAVTIKEMNNLFYREKDEILPLYEELKTTRTAESQVRIALLQSLRNALASGEFETPVESVRKECSDRKCYDKNNFSANFTNNSSLFGFDKYEKSMETIKLSDKGREELGALIKELQ